MKKVLLFLGIAALFGLVAYTGEFSLADDQTIKRPDIEFLATLDSFSTVEDNSYVEWSNNILEPSTAHLGLKLKGADTLTVYVEHGFWTSELSKRWHKGEILYSASPTATFIDTTLQVPVRGRGLRVYVVETDGGTTVVTTATISIAVKPDVD